ncbi:hypothetical protein XENORESO_018115, partial [Xenotaenia resolanae]
ELRTLPDGTELRCNQTEMSLLLPVTSLSNINLAELQLNSPTCPVTYNNTHLIAHIPLSGCGTKAVEMGPWQNSHPLPGFAPISYRYQELVGRQVVERAEMIVTNCKESETEDFAVSRPILQNGVFTGTYTVRSGPVSLVVGDYLGQNVTTTEKPITSITEAPKSNATLPTEPTVPKPTTTPGSTPQISSITRATTKVTSSTTTSQAPEVATSRTTGVILLTISIFLQMNILQ